MIDATELPTADRGNTGYDNARLFDADVIVVHDLDHLSNILRLLLPQKDRCVLSGSLLGGDHWPTTLSPLAGGKGRRL
jgi:hypothetical protein